MKVTDIKQQVKRKDRYSIFVDGKYSFALSESGLISSGLKVGLDLSAQDLEDLKKHAVEDKGVYRALDLIARRPRSAGEITDYLKRKGYEEEEAEKILNRLSEKGYIDDESFARSWVENRRLLKPTSRRKLRLELKQKKVAEDIIQEVLKEGNVDEAETLRKLIVKKLQQARYRDRQKLMQYLARQGFNYSDIKEALDDIAGDA
ncbi:MAG TPA: RecX family transcriptional regulator [Candidatus Saccharimonadales bacterium]|nr:RecX family transcriptional regulator [Candidatus Saccharimonadales bacterium]